jgi:phage terminase large subunit
LSYRCINAKRLEQPIRDQTVLGQDSRFTFSWRQDPRKGEDWYRKQAETLDPVTLAGEVDIDYRGSVEGQLIPSAWIFAAIGAAEKL